MRHSRSSSFSPVGSRAHARSHRYRRPRRLRLLSASDNCAPHGPILPEIWTLSALRASATSSAQRKSHHWAFRCRRPRGAFGLPVFARCQVEGHTAVTNALAGMCDGTGSSSRDPLVTSCAGSSSRSARWGSIENSAPTTRARSVHAQRLTTASLKAPKGLRGRRLTDRETEPHTLGKHRLQRLAQLQ